MAAKVHPELLQQIEEAGSEPVEAVVQLRSPHRLQAVPAPEESAALAETVLQRVQADVGHPPARTNILRNVGAVIVQADAPFIRSLVRQPEVISAIPNRTAESPFIAPKGKRPVE